jgi:hypothetical protein
VYFPNAGREAGCARDSLRLVKWGGYGIILWGIYHVTSHTRDWVILWVTLSRDEKPSGPLLGLVVMSH